MSKYFLRPRARKTREPDAFDPAQVLALVAINTQLTKPTAAALRLTCKATKLAVDQTVKELKLSEEALESLKIKENPLLMGLTALHMLMPEDPENSALSFRTAIKIAHINYETLETLALGVCVEERGLLMLITLGLHQWPQLRSFSFFCPPDTIELFIKVDEMPKLAELRIFGAMSAEDMAVLAAGRYFPSTVEVLELRLANASRDNPAPFYASLKDLMHQASNLRDLDLSIHSATSLDFLEGAELPALEILALRGVPSGASLSPITSAPRFCLQHLELTGNLETGNAAVAADLAGLFSRPLPALEDLYMHFNCADMRFMRDISANSLKNLALLGWTGSKVNAGHIGAAVGRLPALENLQLYPEEGDNGPVDSYDCMKGLLEGIPAPHPRLRGLETGGAWADDDDSLETLAYLSTKVPVMEEVVMTKGRVSRYGFKTLAESYHGALPALELLALHLIVDTQADDSGDEWERNGIHEDADKIYWCVRLLKSACPKAKLALERKEVV